MMLRLTMSQVVTRVPRLRGTAAHDVSVNLLCSTVGKVEHLSRGVCR